MVEVTYTYADGIDCGVLEAYQLDLAYGSDENDFELTLPAETVLEAGSMIYIDGTEWGGIVRGGRESMLDAVPTYVATGETWHGKLASTYLCFAEEMQVSGEANEAVRTVISSVGLEEVFDVSLEDSGILVEHRLPPMGDVYTALCEMLAEAGAKLQIVKESGSNPMLASVPIGTYIDTDGLSKYGYELVWCTPVNHLICLGPGEGENRELFHLYSDAEGRVSGTQTIFGFGERQFVFDGSASNDELWESAENKLRELQNTNTCELSLPKDVAYGVGDVVGVVSEKTGISITSTVTKVIVKVSEDGLVEVTNEIGDAAMLGSTLFGKQG